MTKKCKTRKDNQKCRCNELSRIRIDHFNKTLQFTHKLFAYNENSDSEENEKFPLTKLIQNLLVLPDYIKQLH